LNGACREWDYWGKPVPSFDGAARVLILGLALGAHGSNRTGRMFTGDRSGDTLYSVLHRTSFASQAASTAIRQYRIGQGQPVLVGSCHPRQQKTSADKLTEKMLVDVFLRARRLADVAPVLPVGPHFSSDFVAGRVRSPWIRGARGSARVEHTWTVCRAR
jgi:uracil-DNA glycosylase